MHALVHHICVCREHVRGIEHVQCRMHDYNLHGNWHYVENYLQFQGFFFFVCVCGNLDSKIGVHTDLKQFI